MKHLLLLLACIITRLAVSPVTLQADSIHLLVWDERQPRQEQAYDNFLGNEIVAQLKASAADFDLRSAALDDPDQGLSAGLEKRQPND